ncbi:hypothetical protein [Aquipuribacter sp. MA13-6]|uniref:hypothetical protein n=1 Tax=unclassified Aquipuribacter TaxID=2635084 RepID=UPI003EEA180B
MQRGSRTGPLRSGVDAADRSRVAAVLGVEVRDEDARWVLDPRGTPFQRLEWQGDSALDAVVAVHRWGGPACCADLGTADLVSDAALARSAAVAGLPALLDWDTGPGRLADCVEASVGAAWHLGVAAAAVTTARLVHQGVTVADVAARPGVADVPDALECDALTPPAHVGSAVMEAAAADHLIARADLAGADEGGLSTVRARLLDGERVLQVAADHGWLPGCGRHPHHLLDHVQARVGLVALVRGLPAGLREADRLW